MNLLFHLYFKLIGVSWRVLMVLTICLVMFATISLKQIEPQTFHSYSDSLWFTSTTISTTGYGDLAPKTLEGRLFTMVFLHVIGGAIFISFIGKSLESIRVYQERKEGGDMMYSGKNHIVIFGWSHKSQNAIKQLGNKQIVVVDNLEKLTYVSHNIHYIKGNATDINVLNKANIKQASHALIFADDNVQDQVLTDGKSLLIACAIEKIAPQVITIVEIEREEHIESFSHAKVDEFIVSNGTIAKMVIDKCDI